MAACFLSTTMFVTVLIQPLFSQSILWQSDLPLPAKLEKEIRGSLADAGVSQSNLYVKIHGDCNLTHLFANGDDRPLGWVERVDGQMLSIVHIDCQRICQ